MKGGSWFVDMATRRVSEGIHGSFACKLKTVARNERRW